MSLKLPKLNLPFLPEKIEKKEGRNKIWDPIRKKWLILTPEEWVRQSFVQFMHREMGYPLSLTRTEYSLQLNNTEKRADIVYYDSEQKPRVIVECKAANIPLDKSVFEQVSRYYIALGVDYMILTNGLNHMMFKFNGGEVEFLKEILHYDDLS